MLSSDLLVRVAVLIAATGLVACASRSARLGIPTCPRGPVQNYLADEVLQCWFDGPSGRWRTLNHEFHYDSLVFEVEAASLEDARTIAERIVSVHGKRFLELALYVQTSPSADGGPRHIRRIRWSSRTGYEPPLDFDA